PDDVSMTDCAGPLASGNGPDNEEGLRPRSDRVRQRCVRWFMGEILLAGEETQERPALLRNLIADRPAQHRIAGLECGKDGALRNLTAHLELSVAAHARQCSRMWRKHDSDHGSVWTSTESTPGRSRTMGAQFSPA